MNPQKSILLPPMRIIAGKYKRRALSSPRGNHIRPTTDRVRESAFNLIEGRVDLENASVMDLFAGTGALGLEALSRGAARVTFVESDSRVLQVTKRNAASLDALSHCIFLPMSATDYLKRSARTLFDLILADPPYDLEEMQTMPDIAQAHLTEDGIFVLEHDRRVHFDGHPRLITSRKYGRTSVSIFGGQSDE